MIYRLSLGLNEMARQTNLSWLVAALRREGAELSELSRPRPDRAVAVVRAPFALEEGTVLVASAEGLQFPGPLPQAVVLEVTETKMFVHPAEAAAMAAERAGIATELQLTAAALLLGATWYLSRRIEPEATAA